MLPLDVGHTLHPELHALSRRFNGFKTLWFHNTLQLALEWQAALTHQSPVETILSTANFKDNGYQQAWIASPYQAQLVRDKIMIMPEHLVPWQTTDAKALCDQLNPILHDEGMHLIANKQWLLLLSKNILDADPPPFSQIQGSMLPNRPIAGADGGRINRILSEIQMLLHATHHAHTRKDHQTLPNISGLWLWGKQKMTEKTSLPSQSLSIYCDYQQLPAQSGQLQKSTSPLSRLRILHAERLSDHPINITDFQSVLLTSKKHVAQLKRSWIPNVLHPYLPTKQWQPKMIQPFSTIISTLSR
ncbi:MAG: hypothetical protein HQM07_02810 [Zetaproteobacteria bacterium]|nr:hypothetical protein [Zetaproteobacteria bacterium]